MAIEAGDVVWTITGDSRKLNAALDKGKRGAAGLAASFKKHSRAIGAGMTVMGGVVTGVMAKVVTSFANTGDEIQKMALRTGFSTEALSELGFAARRSGASLETIEKASKKMSQTIFEAGDEASKSFAKQEGAIAKLQESVDKNVASLAKARAEGKKTETAQERLEKSQDRLNAAIAKGSAATGTYTEALGAIGLTYQDIAGLSPEEQFLIVASALADVEDQTAKVALAQEIFGRAGTALLPMLADGAAGLEEMRQKARDLGLVFDQEAADKAAEFKDRLEDLQGAMQGLVIQIGPIIADVLIPFIEKMVEGAASAGKWAKENQPLVGAMVKVAGAVGVMMLVLGPLVIMLPAIAAGVSLFGAASGGAAVGVGALAVATGLLATLGIGALVIAASAGLVAIGAFALESLNLAQDLWQVKTSGDAVDAGLRKLIASYERAGLAIDKTRLAGLEYQAALDELNAQVEAQRGKQRDATAEQAKAEAALKKTTGALEDTTGATLESTEAIDIHDQSIFSAIGMTGRFGGINFKLTTVLQDVASAIGTGTEELGKNEGALDSAAGSAFNAGSGYFSVGQNAFFAANGVAALNRELAKTPKGGNFASGGVIPGFAAGGVIPGFANGGRIVQVGERGPELAFLPVGTRVLSNGESKQAVNDAVRGADQNMTFNFGDIVVQGSENPQQSAKDIVDALKVEMGRQLRDAQATF